MPSRRLRPAVIWRSRSAMAITATTHNVATATATGSITSTTVTRRDHTETMVTAAACFAAIVMDIVTDIVMDTVMDTDRRAGGDTDMAMDTIPGVVTVTE